MAPFTTAKVPVCTKGPAGSWPDACSCATTALSRDSPAAFSAACASGLTTGVTPGSVPTSADPSTVGSATSPASATQVSSCTFVCASGGVPAVTTTSPSSIPTNASNSASTSAAVASWSSSTVVSAPTRSFQVPPVAVTVTLWVSAIGG